MTDWTSGYVADIGYTYGYYQELNPLRAKLAFLNAGLAPPEFGTACELGFGQGISANIHNAASATVWHGTDFNPAQASFAQELAAASGSGAKLYDDAFAEFAHRNDLPDFDFIGIHGIWSWISDDNRRIIVDFIRRKLKVGGVLYISYNTLPGWAAFAPMRHLMTQHAEVMGAEGGGIVNRIDTALEFAEKLLATQPSYARANTQVAGRIQKIKDQNRHYLAHEYFNRDWHPMHVATMKDWLAPAKVQYACSAHYLDHVDAINLTSDQQVFLKSIPDPMFRETARDFMVNQQFRRDYWVKGARKLNAFELGEKMRQQKVVLLTHRPDVSLKVTGSLGEANMSESAYAPVLDILADHTPISLGQIEQTLKKQGAASDHLREVIMVLSGSGHLAAVQNEAAIDQAVSSTNKLNVRICQMARSSSEITCLASPVTGGGVSIGRFQQLFLLALQAGYQQPIDWAKFAWDIMAPQGQRLMKEGKVIEAAEDNLAELAQHAQTFAEKHLPALKSLRVLSA